MALADDEAIESPIAQMEQELHHLRAAETSSPEGYRAALGDLVRSWRARLDHARVQAELGRREIRDEVDQDLERAEHLWSQIRQRSERLGEEASELTADVRDDIRELVESIGEAFREASDRLAHRLDDEDRAAGS